MKTSYIIESKITKIWLFIFMMAWLSTNAYSQKVQMAYKDSTSPITERVRDLLSRMSLKEKVAQMRIFHSNKGVEFSEDDEMVLSDDVKSRLKNGIAGIKNPGEDLSPVRAAQLNNKLQKYIIEHNRWGIPALFITESYNGVDAKGCTRFGRPLTMASSFNPELVHQVWDVVGREARLRGMHMCHSPEADIERDPRFGRMSEAFGEDTYLVTQMITQAVKGVQGDYKGLGNGTHIGAVVKHFAGYGQIAGGRNFASVEISPRKLEDEIFPPFKAAIKKAHTLGIMASHSDINGVASHANPWLLTDVLRNQWGFKGYVVSDANDIARLYSFMHVAESPQEATMLALKAGVDVDLYSDDAYALLPDIVKNHPALKKMINRSAGRVLRTKFILGLFDHPYVDTGKTKSYVHSKQNIDLALKADLESIILLKNDSKTLPLHEQKKMKIGLLGPLLDSKTKEAFEKVAGNNIRFTADKGFQLTDQNSSDPKLLQWNHSTIKELIEKAKKTDLNILFVGGDEYTAKEAYFNSGVGDRATIKPVGPQNELVRQIKALGKPVIVVLKHRRTLAIDTISEQADAIVDGWDLSEMGDQALAQIIFGKVAPSGKLPVTVPRMIGQHPFHYSQKEINFKKGYLFLQKGPLYPFGFGLSYADFAYSNLKLSSDEITPDSQLKVSVDITNTGNVKAKEVVQMYIKDEVGQVLRPDKELKGFRKIRLKPDETKTVFFTISPDMLKFTGLKMKKILEAGNYTVMVGTSSAEVKKASFRLSK